jgi:hypothetical protein
MKSAIAKVTPNDAPTAKVPKRDVIKLADFENVSLSDVHHMFGTWKETDHCDKEISG